MKETMDLKKFKVVVHRFNPATGLNNGEEFVLPVDSPDEEQLGQPKLG